MGLMEVRWHGASMTPATKPVDQGSSMCQHTDTHGHNFQSTCTAVLLFSRTPKTLRVCICAALTVHSDFYVLVHSFSVHGKNRILAKMSPQPSQASEGTAPCRCVWSVWDDDRCGMAYGVQRLHHCIEMKQHSVSCGDLTKC